MAPVNPMPLPQAKLPEEMTLEEQRDELLGILRKAHAHCPDRCGSHCETTRSLLDVTVARYIGVAE